MNTNQALVKVLSTDTLVIRIDLFLREIAKTKSKATIDTYRRSLGIFTLWIDEQGGKLKLSQKNLEMYPVYLRDRRKVTVRTVDTYLNALRNFFAFLSKEGMLDENPAENLRPTEKVISKSRDVLTPDEVQRLLEISSGEDQVQIRDKAILLCMLLEGLSEDDIVKSNFGDIENTILGEELRIKTKGGPISIRLDQRTFKALSDYIAIRSGPIKLQDPLFITHHPRISDERISHRSVRSRMRILLNRAKITREDVSPKSISHTAILLHIHNGTSREDLRIRFRPWRLFYRIQDLKDKGLIDPSY